MPKDGVNFYIEQGTLTSLFILKTVQSFVFHSYLIIGLKSF